MDYIITLCDYEANIVEIRMDLNEIELGFLRKLITEIDNTRDSDDHPTLMVEEA